MERPINDFDEEIYNQLTLLGLTDEEEAPRGEKDYNDIIDESTGQERMRFYDPLTPIINRLHMRPVNNHDDYFGETPAFI